MAFSFQKPYGPAIEQPLRQYDQSLSEKDRRRFAAVEAITLGHGGTRYIANVLGGDPQTVKDGMRELKQLPDDPAGNRVRKPGGGRQKAEAKQPDLIQQVQHTIKDRTAGDPMRQDVVWTDVTPQEIADSLPAQAVCAGPRLVRRILETLGVARRQMAKVLPGGDSPHRDAPFRHVSHLIQEFLEAGNPVLSIDTKKKECLGTLYRDGQGHSVFKFNTDESQCLRRLGSQPAASRRNVGMARPPQEPNSGIAERRHHLRDVATAHLRAVFIKRHIAYPMGLVLNLPMTSDKLQQPIGGGPLGA